jgi:hypothetical protein
MFQGLNQRKKVVTSNGNFERKDDIKMLNQIEGTCMLVSLNINPNGKISGRVSLRTYCEGGNVTSYYGARFEGLAAEKVRELQPGAIFRIVDGDFEDIPNRDGGSWTCIIIRNFELIKASGMHSPKSSN